MQTLEAEYIDNDTEDYRAQVHQAQAEHTKWLKYEESILKQKANIRWLEEGDANTKYFHAIINEKRRRRTLQRIQNSDGNWINEDENISREAIKYFSTLLQGEFEPEYHHLDCLSRIITHQDNELLCVIPEEEEIRKAVFDTSPNSAPGPDGFGGSFFQNCWDIIKKELICVVQSFFNGAELSKFYTNSCLVLLPKVENPTSFNEMRPISLSNCSNKIISKIMTARLTPLLSKVISDNQSDFIKGRSIT